MSKDEFEKIEEGFRIHARETSPYRVDDSGKAAAHLS